MSYNIRQTVPSYAQTTSLPPVGPRPHRYEFEYEQAKIIPGEPQVNHQFNYDSQPTLPKQKQASKIGWWRNMSGKAKIISLVVTFTVIVGAAVGGGVGSSLSKKSKSSTPGANASIGQVFTYCSEQTACSGDSAIKELNVNLPRAIFDWAYSMLVDLRHQQQFDQRMPLHPHVQFVVSLLHLCCVATGGGTSR